MFQTPHIQIRSLTNATRLSFLTLSFSLFLVGCNSSPPSRLSPADSLRVVREIMDHRADVDSFFRHSPDSPFNLDTGIDFGGIRWFPPDTRLFLQSKLHRVADPETVVVLGTQGEERRHLKYGYFLLYIDNKNVRLNVYKYFPVQTRQQAQHNGHLDVWFTDRTTGKESYDVGRYLDVGPESPDPEFIYTIDFNGAYNPYCAYSTHYSCAIPRREDYLDVAIRAGEMKCPDDH